MSDVAVIGGGIVGCALAAFLAEGGAETVLYEREAIAAGASGRNSGVVQHPFDAELVGLYEQSLELYRELEGFELPAEHVGLLVLGATEEPTEFPELQPTFIEDARSLEPALAPGIPAVRFETGRPVPPAAAAHAWEHRARRAGAQIRVGETYEGGATTQVIAAGPWSAELADVPITPIWGVVVELELPNAPLHVLEEAGIVDALSSADVPEVFFSAVTARGISAIGSTFVPERPDPERVAPAILEHAKQFLPQLGTRRGLRACARPGSADGRPILGRLSEDVYVASGHGAWGITLGPASARLVADQILGRPAEIPPALSATRWRCR